MSHTDEQESATCKNGHDLTDPANVVAYRHGRNGAITRRCKICWQAYQRTYQHAYYEQVFKTTSKQRDVL